MEGIPVAREATNPAALAEFPLRASGVSQSQSPRRCRPPVLLNPRRNEMVRPSGSLPELSRGVPIHGAASSHVVLDLAPSSAPPLVECFRPGAAEADFPVQAQCSRGVAPHPRFLAPQTELLAIDPE